MNFKQKLMNLWNKKILNRQKHFKMNKIKFRSK